MEAQAVKIFLKPQQPAMTNHEIIKKGYVDSIVDDADKKKRRRLYALIISPATSIVERANSHAKLNMANRRSLMSP